MATDPPNHFPEVAVSARMKLITPGHIALLAIVALLLLVAPHLAGQVDTTGVTAGGGIDIQFVVKGLSALAIPALAVALWNLTKKKGLTFIDDWDTLPQQAVAFLFGVLVSWLSGKLGTVLPTDYHLWNAGVVENVLTGLATLGSHAIWKQK